jgi:hypothetical protein
VKISGFLLCSDIFEKWRTRIGWITLSAYLSSKVKTLTLKDGRRLCYTEYGSPAGSPVIRFHGTPGSRFVFKVMDRAATAAWSTFDCA